MVITKATSKGQVIIPADIRKRFKITKGTRLAISIGEGNAIVVRTIPDDPIEASRRMLKGKTSLIKALLKDRLEETRRG
jgi:AbrB family looped-hinge helix DNA binding protein